MKCMEREKLFAYVHHLLESREEAEVRAHVAKCPACNRTLGEYQKLDAVLEEWKPDEPSPWFDVRVLEAIRQTPASQSASSFFSLAWMRRLAPAFLVVLVVTASVVFLRVRQSRVISQAGGRHASASAPAAASTVSTASQPEAEPGAEELTLYEDLPVLEDYDLLTNFEVLSELPRGEAKVAN